MPSNKKIFFGLACSLLLTWYIVNEGVLGVGMAAAQPVGASPGGTGSLSTAQLLEKLGLFFDVAIFLMHVMLQIVSGLIDPGLLISTTGGGNLIGIWRISRDITNVIFAFMLIFVALYAVINPDGGMSMIKEKIGKFVLAVVLVNFSWFFPRVILDVANVLTATIYQIPPTIRVECETTDDDGVPTECKYIKRVWLDPKGAKAGGATVPDECFAASTPNFKVYGDIVCVEIGPWNDDFNTGHAMLQGLYINHVRVLSVAKVLKDPGPADGSWAGIKELGRFFVHFVFSFIYLIAALIPIITMAVVFVIRLVMIWITVAFMPFMFVGFVMGDKMGEFNTMNIIFKKFVAAAFLPTAIAIPLVVGFIMINSVSGTCPAADPKFAFMCEDHGMIIPGVKTMWQLMWNFTAIMIMWIGFFSALKIDTIYASVGGMFKGIGENWFKFALKAPLALPIIPVGKGKQSVMETLGGSATMAAIKDPNLLISPKGSIDFDDFKKQFGSGAKDARTDETLRTNKELNDKLKDLTTAINNQGGADNATAEQIRGLKDFFRNNPGLNIRAALQSDTLGEAGKVRGNSEQIDNLARKIQEELDK
jgi:hypothetical protein